MPTKITNMHTERDIRDLLEAHPVQHFAFRPGSNEIVSIFGSAPYQYANNELSDFLEDINTYKSEEQLLISVRERPYAIELCIKRSGDQFNIASKGAIRVNEANFGSDRTLEQEFFRLLPSADDIKPDILYTYEL